MKNLLMIIILLFVYANISAQDVIYKRNGKQINCKVIEIGTAEVKYTTDTTQKLIYVVEKDQLIKIVFENGNVENFVLNIKDLENYAGQKTAAIKFDFFGPLVGYTQISYEKNMGVGKSYELTLGIIGLGKTSRIHGLYDLNFQPIEKRTNQFGLFVAAGYKFNKLPDFLFGRTRFTHLMQGSYVKPTIYLGNYSENRISYKNNTNVIERPKTTFAALQVEFGKQWVMGDAFVLDTYWGLGYGIDNKKYNGDFMFDDNSTAYHYVSSRLGRSPGVSFTFGVKMGLLLKSGNKK
ncbi:MAG: hypothetical protein ACOVNR_09435 [Chitinophagaceae bacterium]